MNPAFRTTFAWILRIGLGLLFAVAGAEKILDPVGFAFAVDRYGILPEAAVPAVALGLPWVEVLSAGVLLIPSWRQSGQMLIAAMMAVFVAAVTYALVSGIEGECGCLAGMALSWPTAILKALLLGAAVWLVREDQAP